MYTILQWYYGNKIHTTKDIVGSLNGIINTYANVYKTRHDIRMIQIYRSNGELIKQYGA